MNRKADFSWETLAKLMIALVLLVFILTALWLSKDKIFSLIDKLKNILRFGG
jgi:hypothetical protein